jgi:hypothetical protein
MPLHHTPDAQTPPAPEPAPEESSFISETMVGQIVRDSVRRRVPVAEIAREVRTHTGPQPAELPATLPSAPRSLWQRFAGVFRRQGS